MAARSNCEYHFVAENIRKTYLCQRGNQNLSAIISKEKEERREKLTDMDDVTFTVNHDISIMPILYLQYVTSDRIGCH